MRLSRRRFIGIGASLGVGLGTGLPTAARSSGGRALRIIVPFAPGRQHRRHRAPADRRPDEGTRPAGHHREQGRCGLGHRQRRCRREECTGRPDRAAHDERDQDPAQPRAEVALRLERRGSDHDPRTGAERVRRARQPPIEVGGRLPGACTSASRQADLWLLRQRAPRRICRLNCRSCRHGSSSRTSPVAVRVPSSPTRWADRLTSGWQLS